MTDLGRWGDVLRTVLSSLTALGVGEALVLVPFVGLALRAIRRGRPPGAGGGGGCMAMADEEVRRRWSCESTGVLNYGLVTDGSL